MAFSRLPPTQLLGLIAVNFAPLSRGSDARCRSSWNSFPAEDVAEDDVRALHRKGLVEMTPTAAVVTHKGQRPAEAHGAKAAPAVAPALEGTRGAHLSLQ